MAQIIEFPKPRAFAKLWKPRRAQAKGKLITFRQGVQGSVPGQKPLQSIIMRILLAGEP